MGGRGRPERKPEVLPDRFMWLREVPDDRLERYGHMTGNRYAEGQSTIGQEALMDHAAREWERRHGEEPEWHWRNVEKRYQKNVADALAYDKAEKAEFFSNRIETAEARAVSAKEKRSLAAKKGWETRRARQGK